MTKENRIKLGKLWKKRILLNKNRPVDKQLKVPKGITLNHPYILEADKKLSVSKDVKKDVKNKKKGGK